MPRAFPCKSAIDALLAAALLALQGCTVGPQYHPPAPPSVTTYTPQPLPSQTYGSPGAAGEPQHFRSSADLPAEWWTLFHSAQLDGMVRLSLDNSPTLEAATARLQQAQEQASRPRRRHPLSLHRRQRLRPGRAAQPRRLWHSLPQPIAVCASQRLGRRQLRARPLRRQSAPYREPSRPGQLPAVATRGRKTHAGGRCCGRGHPPG